MDFVRRDFFALIDRTSNLDWLLLTKRPENVLRMWPARDFGRATMQSVMDSADHPGGYYRPNCWLLYSASDQASLDAGLPHLLACRDLVPVLGLSLEPLIGPVLIDLDGIDWVIVGGESGPGFRPMVIDWVRSIADQCAAAGVSCFIKQDCGRKPGQQGRIPDDLWSLKQFPKV
jgi:protein gp37